MSLQKHAGTVYLFSKLLKFADWLQRLPHQIIPPPFRLIQIGSAFWQSRALYVAVRLDIATTLADQALAADVLAARVSAQTDAVYRLLRMLAALGIFEEISPRIFKNNTLSNYLREDHPKNVRAMILMHNSAEMSRPWFEQLEQGIRTGNVPFESVHGNELYTHMDRNTEFDALFARAMDSVQALTGDSYAHDFAWERFERVIDVGGSKGSKALTLLKQHPHLNAVVFDRPQVIDTAADYWATHAAPELLNRVSFVVGKLLESVPAAKNGKDIYLLSAVLHGMDHKNCVRALRNLAEAIGDTGAVIAIMELVMPDPPADFASAAFDMQMFMGTQGRERTLSEWHQLFAQAGQALHEQVNLRSMGKILVVIPNAGL
ncbi:methyltransferase [Methylomonas sp. 2BW1-5-20]|uniref:methyltransferase n=1 Tax=Methylomonas sp. 2BW1-5-20 TaxID=3376686 RepID=UPI004050E9A5